MSATRPTDRAAAPVAEAALWSFCEHVYGRPGVADVCLELQDRHGADIPLLLAALWSAVEGPGVLAPEELSALDSLVAPWRDNVVRPLRQVRRWMKGAGHGDMPLREQVKADELAAERRELALIGEWLSQRPRGRRPDDAARAALGVYFAWLGCAAVDPGALATAVQRRSR